MSRRPRAGGIATSLARAAAREDGFTLIELVLVALMLAVLAAAVGNVLLAGASTTRQAQLRTTADQLAAAEIDKIRTLPYDLVGLPDGNPPGSVVSPDTTLTDAGGVPVIVTAAIGFVDDSATPLATYADYKKVVVTVTRTSDGSTLARKTTFVAPSSGAPDLGQRYVSIRRQVVDMDALKTPLAGARVSLATGPSAPRSDLTDSTGTVLFPAMDADATGSLYDVTASLSGYGTYPEDMPPWVPGQATLLPGQSDGPKLIRMYKAGISLTVKLVTTGGTPYTGGATVYVGAPDCGTVATVPSGQSSTTINTVSLGNSYLNVDTIAMPPMQFAVSAQSGTKLAAKQTVSVPSSYPTNLSSTVTLTMPSSGSSLSTLTVSVKKGGGWSGGTAVPNAHVEVSTGSATYLFGITDGSGNATFSVPSGSYTIKASDAVGDSASTSTSVSGSKTVTVNF